MTTHFSGGVELAGTNQPANSLPYSHLIGPSGKSLFVAPYRTSGGTANGASDSNPGSLDQPLKTVAAAYALCTGGKGEVIYLLGYSNTAANITDDWSATMTWAKDFVHLVGLVPPVAVSQRARIQQLSTATAISPLLNVTGNNNVFANFQIFQGVDDATSLINVKVTGARNVFENVHIAGIGHATMSAAGSASLVLDGASETVFRNCTIGLDTITRDADAREIILDSGASRNLFDGCLVQGFIGATGYHHVKIADATGFDRWLRFRDCTFLSESANDASVQAAVFDIPAMVQGYILLEGTTMVVTPTGVIDWDANNRARIYSSLVAPTAAAAGGIATRQ